RKMLVVALATLDQPAVLFLPGPHQSPDEGGLAGSPGTPQQAIVGRQATDELTGVGLQQLLLPVHADQIVQALLGGDLQGPQPAATALAHPAGSKGVAPVQRRSRWWQGLFIAVVEADNALHEFGGGDIAHGPSGSDDVQARDSNRRHTELMQ